MSTDIQREIFDALKRFTGFGEADAQVLLSIKPVAMAHQGRITDEFYAGIQAELELAGFVEGRIESLKKTHRQWYEELFCGVYDEAYFAKRHAIGLAHVRIGLRPYWVEGVMNIIRTRLIPALQSDPSVPFETASAAVLKVLDLDLAIINLSYQQDRIDRLSDFTGMSKKLIENIINLPPRKSQ